MRETEITVEVLNDFLTLQHILKENGYELIEEYRLNDLYYSKYSLEQLIKMNYSDLLKNSILIRNVLDDNPKHQIVFKDKTLDKNNNVISEQKYICKIDDINNASKVFDMAGLTCWSDLRQRIYAYRKGIVNFAVEVIDDLGIFIEYEEDETMKSLTESEKINLMFERLKETGLKLGEDYSCKKVYLKFKKDNNIN